jgi:hypothetical protein
MEAFLPLLATCGRPIHSHDAWHLALLHLEELDVTAAMRVFHAHIWGITPDFVVEQLDAIALLWRIEMAGTAMDGQWPSIADHVAGRATETFMPFMNAHYVYALARAGRRPIPRASPPAKRARRSTVRWRADSADNTDGQNTMPASRRALAIERVVVQVRPAAAAPGHRLPDAGEACRPAEQRNRAAWSARSPIRVSGACPRAGP